AERGPPQWVIRERARGEGRRRIGPVPGERGREFHRERLPGIEGASCGLAPRGTVPSDRERAPNVVGRRKGCQTISRNRPEKGGPSRVGASAKRQAACPLASRWGTALRMRSWRALVEFGESG